MFWNSYIIILLHEKEKVVENMFDGEQRPTAVVDSLPSMWDNYIFVVSAQHTSSILHMCLCIIYTLNTSTVI